MIIIEIVAKVSIEGAGVAACCAAHLLNASGRSDDRARVPAVLLSNTAQLLICDIFGRKNLFDCDHRIRKRIVAWGGQRPVTVEHVGVVVSEQQLLDRLRPAIEETDATAPWTIFTSRARHSVQRQFGTRIATAARVEIAGDSSACAIESLDAGWLFLVPDSVDCGWLLSVGEARLSRSLIVAKMISRVIATAGEFPAYPRIVSPLAGAGWLACGSAAMGFDPICGDGAANAVREAILAAAVIRAALNGADPKPLLKHYDARLKLGFKRHLMLCRDFYRADGAWWDRERASLEEGISWCGAEPRFDYQLVGFDLRPVSA
jgi:hypothetical protein